MKKLSGKRALALVLASLSISCSDKIEPVPESTAKPPILIGVVLGKEGSSASSALSMQPAFDAALAAVNAAGGIDGRQVAFEVRDDKDRDGDFIRSIAEELIEKGVIGILGPVRSKQLLDMSEVTLGVVPVISASATSPELSSRSLDGETWLFRTVPNDNAQADAIVKFAQDGINGHGGSCDRLSIVYQDDAYGEGLKNAVQAAFPTGGVVSTHKLGEVPLSASEYRSEVITALANAKPGCVSLIAVEDVGGAFVRALDESKSLFTDPYVLIGADGLYNDGFLVETRTDKGNPNTSTASGMFGTVPEPNPAGLPEYNEFMLLHRQFFPTATSLTSYVAASFDAAALLLLARAAAGSDNPARVREALEQVSTGGERVRPGALASGIQLASEGIDINYNGASGPVDFLSGGDVESAYSVWTITGGRFETVGSFSAEQL